MYGQQQYNNWHVILRILGRNLPIVTFLILSNLGMLTVYWYFRPTFGEAEVVAAAAIDTAVNLSAPLYKEVPSRPLLQRLPQSPGPIRIGLISGHKDHDPGAVCEDGLTEAEVNANIASKVAATLQANGIHTDILAEFDPRLEGYRGTALISIHADSCLYYNELATGFKAVGSSATGSDRLLNCVQSAYATHTQLSFHANTITPHMTDYHAFREIHPRTPAIILEVGFMNLDRELITTEADKPAAGISEGILCFLNRQT